MRQGSFFAAPAHPDSRITERMARRVARPRGRSAFDLAGLDAPSAFRMREYVQNPGQATHRLVESAPGVTGSTFQFCILLVGFTDKPVQVGNPFFEDLIFGEDDGASTAANYYLAESRNQLLLRGTVTPIVLPNDYAYYVNNN